MKTYFDTAVREGRYYSEDWTFCENWRDIGGQVWVDKRVLLRHTGTYVFDGNAQEQVFRDLRAIFDPTAHAVAEQAAQAAAQQAALIPPPPAEPPPAEPPPEPKATVLASSKKKKPKKVANSK
jgi:hypothetical protein